MPIPAIDAGRTYDAFRRARRRLPADARAQISGVSEDALWALAILVRLLGGASYPDLGFKAGMIKEQAGPYAKLPGMPLIIQGGQEAADAETDAALEGAAGKIARGIVEVGPGKLAQVTQASQFGVLVGAVKGDMPRPTLPEPPPYEPPAPPPSPPAAPPPASSSPPAAPPPARPPVRPRPPVQPQPPIAKSPPPAPAPPADGPGLVPSPDLSTLPDAEWAQAVQRQIAEMEGEWIEQNEGETDAEWAARVQRELAEAPGVWIDEAPKVPLAVILDAIEARIRQVRSSEGYTGGIRRFEKEEEEVKILRPRVGADAVEDRLWAAEILARVGGTMPASVSEQRKQEVRALRVAGPLAARQAAEKSMADLLAYWEDTNNWWKTAPYDQTYWNNAFGLHIENLKTRLAEGVKETGEDYVTVHIAIHLQAQAMKEQLEKARGQESAREKWNRQTGDKLMQVPVVKQAAETARQVAEAPGKAVQAVGDAVEKVKKDVADSVDKALEKLKTGAIIVGCAAGGALLIYVVVKVAGRD